MNLKKELRTIDIFAIAVGAMISSGIFVLPGLAYAKTGPAIIISYILAGAIALFGILSVIELTTAMPKAGGDYFFITRTLGPLIGTISGILSWIAISLKTAFAIFGLSELIVTLLFHDSHHYLYPTAVIVTIFFLILNYLGVDFASKFEVFLVTILITIISFYIITGFFKIDFNNFIPFIRNYNLENSLYKGYRTLNFLSISGFKSIIIVVALIYVSFGGLFTICTVSEEVKNPRKSIFKGVVSSIVFTTILYGFILFVAVGASDGDTIANSLNPIADTAKAIGGNYLYYALVTAAMIAFITTGNAGIMAASRYPFALSRDNLIPHFIGKISTKFRTPMFSILLTGLFIMLSLLLPLEILAKTASSVILMTYMLTNLSVIIIREAKISNYNPTFTAPFYPWLQIIIISVFSYFIYYLGFTAIKLGFGLVILGVIIYFLYGKKNSIKEYALMHLIVRLADNLQFDYKLESELRDIIIERDDFEQDIFDKLVQDAIILDFNHKMDLDQLFEIEANHLSNKLNLTNKELIHLFNEREREASTAVTPFTAIPHIVVSEMKEFLLVVIRNKEGIRFNEQRQEIKAVFMFISGKNLQKSHLKILAGIASLTSEKQFEKNWIEADGVNAIRDLILLSKRKRHN